ncbi:MULTISPECIES: TIGR03905 family TSCPD domain-containing protein [Fusobacterium]|jgi:uncharacterized protein (TIGR03905 family)|nr:MULTISPECIES: TIGR03905 family TSCPD domain-containing protein [Fusobacterium]MCF0169783.1 TIGR03905 family TSCPD domain-containing protein [Fusobacterium varium]MCF2672634.1 TIGR03905 family TSCPD domain-containing protein [Fusobacterium varium]MCI6031743.1 TIGR03905 family TSCPD domain-containing protein [Fusobacterium varium]MDY4005699.1 TIGR03905 family TSCPD domain-containing protein [Fusobacterium varium]OFL93310.1 TSCPD domain-containing protein [Fusobacterium sp. HMSC073F01]
MEMYKTNGVCAKEIGVEVENGILRKVKFFGCCDGDSKAFEILLKDMEINKIINDLYHIECRERGTSCMRELCKILMQLTGR